MPACSDRSISESEWLLRGQVDPVFPENLGHTARRLQGFHDKGDPREQLSVLAVDVVIERDDLDFRLQHVHVVELQFLKSCQTVGSVGSRVDQPSLAIDECEVELVTQLEICCLQNFPGGIIKGRWAGPGR